MEKMRSFLEKRVERSLLAAAGLLVCALGTYFQLQANMGMAPWEALNQGLAIKFNTTYGSACIVVALLVLVADLALKEQVGIGTILDAFLVGMGVDFCTSMNFIPQQTKMPGQLGLLLLGIMTICVGQALYMKAALCCGPRDALMVGLGKRVSRLPIGLVNITILATVLAIGIPLGSPIGLGTVICAFGTGIIMEGVFRIMHFKPRSVVHEGVFETIRMFTQLLGGESRKKAA